MIPATPSFLCRPKVDARRDVRHRLGRPPAAPCQTDVPVICLRVTRRCCLASWSLQHLQSSVAAEDARDAAVDYAVNPFRPPMSRTRITPSQHPTPRVYTNGFIRKPQRAPDAHVRGSAYSEDFTMGLLVGRALGQQGAARSLRPTGGTRVGQQGGFGSSGGMIGPSSGGMIGHRKPWAML